MHLSFIKGKVFYFFEKLHVVALSEFPESYFAQSSLITSIAAIKQVDLVWQLWFLKLPHLISLIKFQPALQTSNSLKSIFLKLADILANDIPNTRSSICLCYYTSCLLFIGSCLLGLRSSFSPAVFCFVLLNGRFSVSHSRALGGIGLDRGELERCVFASPPPPPPYQEEGFIVHHRVYKGIEKDG